MRRFFIYYVLIALLAVILVISVNTHRYLYRSITDYDDSHEFIISNGESFRNVALRLEQGGIIPSAFILQIYARARGWDSGIQKGTYVIPRKLSAVEIVNFLSSGQQNLLRVTIPEGKTIRQVADIFETSGLVSAEAFKAAAMNTDLIRRMGIPAETAEGYLFPDTYYFSEDFPAEKIVEHMITLFFEKIGEVYEEYTSLSKQELHKIVTMASIVEREYRSEEEAPLIASVFYNRLEQNIRLESCATIVYVMTEIEGLEHPERIFFADLERESDFNTYYHAGLPPTPISGVGFVSLSAAFYPATSNYLYFVLENPNAARHVFSEDYRQHLLASEAYFVKLN